MALDSGYIPVLVHATDLGELLAGAWLTEGVKREYISPPEVLLTMPHPLGLGVHVFVSAQAIAELLFPVDPTDDDLAADAQIARDQAAAQAELAQTALKCP